MIITRSPLRLSLGGGGTDLPSYYREHEGFLLAGAINKYIYVTVMYPFEPGIFLKYSAIEHCINVEDVQHKIIREALKLEQLKTPQIEITTLADIPAGTGLGSSGSFTTALLKALSMHKHRLLLPEDLAKLACHIEIDQLKEPIGKQDQYIAAYGGLTSFTFHKDDTVTAQHVTMPIEAKFEFEERLLLFFTGFSRSASHILKEQHEKSKKNDKEMIDNLHYVKEMGYRSQKLLQVGNIYGFGKLMDEHWQHKKQRSKNMSNPQIDEWYMLGMNNGAIGGKLVGAGGGGFLLFLAEDKVRLCKAMYEAGLEQVRFSFDYEGTKVVFS